MTPVKRTTSFGVYTIDPKTCIMSRDLKRVQKY